MTNVTAKSETFPLADLANVPDDIRETLLAVQVKAGFVPNVFLKLARRPAELRAFVAYHDALMVREEPASPATGGARTRGALEATGSLTKGDREMIVVATSSAAHCLYCIVAHGALLRIYEKKPLVADQVAANYRKADISERQRAMLDFAMKVSLESHLVSEADYEPLRKQGFSDEDIWDIASIAAFFAMSNRLANSLGFMPNEEFFLMGRVPRAKK